jgi:membrane fusion protein (multidrug efflux system)
MSMRLLVIAGAVGAAATVVLSGCSNATKAEGEMSRPAVAVETAAARPVDVQESVEVVGSLTPKFSSDIKSEFTAVVAEVLVTEWVPVKKGQPLARLDTRESEAEVEAVKASLMQAEVADTRAQRELDRAVKLKEVGLITQQGLDDARTAREAAAATTAAVRAQLRAAETRLAKSMIRAPFDGVVAYRGVNVGDRVESMGGGPMFRVVDNRVLDLTVSVPSARLASLRAGEELQFTSDAAPGRTFTGTVAHINPSIDDASRAVKVMAEVHNDDGALKGGLFVKGRILTGERSQVLTVPRAALLSWDIEGGRAEVFTVAEGVARRRSIGTGAAVGDAVEVTGGLQAGEAVITRGGFNVRDGDRVTVAGA